MQFPPYKEGELFTLIRPKPELIRAPYRCSLCDWRPVSPDQVDKEHHGKRLEELVNKEFAIHAKDRHPRRDLLI
jgi:hypothetical protein